MSTPTAATTSSSTISQEITKGISDIKSLVTCKICTRLMYEPYTTKCGHTFCYGCLSKWLGHGHRKRQCPDCRARIKDEPAPNYTIREIVHVLIANSAFIDDDETPESLRTEQLQEASQLESDKTGPNAPGLFKGLFKATYHDPIRDPADGIMRCPHCNWEVEDHFCERCGVDFDDHFWADWSDDEDYDSELDELLEGEEGSGLESEDTDEPNEEDEAFIDDGDIDLGGADNEVGQREVPGYESRSPLYISDDSERETRRVMSNIRRRLRRFHDARTGSEDSTVGASESGTTDSDGSSETSSGSDDSEDDSEEGTEGDSEDDSEDGSSSDSDDEPIVQYRSGRRRGTTSGNQSTANQRPRNQRPQNQRPQNQASQNNRSHNQGSQNNGALIRHHHSNVIDLTSLPSPTISHPRQRQPPLSLPSIIGYNDIATAASTSRNSALHEEQNPEDDSGTDTLLPVRPRKREHIVLSDSDGDDDPVDVQRDSRAQRRRLNHQSIIPTTSGRGRQRAIAGPVLSNPLTNTLPLEQSD